MSRALSIPQAHAIRGPVVVDEASIRAAQTRALFRQGISGTLGNLAALLASLVISLPYLESALRAAPIIAALLVFLHRLVLVARLGRRIDSMADPERWRRRFLWSAAAGGVGWGLSAVALMPVLPLPHQTALIVIVIGLSSAAIGTLGEVVEVFLAYSVPLLLLTAVSVAGWFEAESLALGVLLVVYVGILMKTSLTHARSLRNALVLSLERASLVEELEAAMGEARAASQAKSDLLAHISHEIRTPMNALVGTTELLAETSLPARGRHLARIAHHSSRLLLSLLNDVLDMSCIEAGRLELDEAPLSVERVLEDVTTMLGVAAERKGVTLVCHTSSALLGGVMGDEIRLRQIVTNLTSNALKFTQSGEIEVSAELGGEAGRALLIVTVRDTGEGIPEESLGRLFGAFERVKTPGVGAQPGAGLGLSISADLAALMGGEISVESALGEGSRFVLTLPYRPPLDPLPRDRPALLGCRVGLSLDQPLEARVWGAWLSEAGAEVVTLDERAPAVALDAVVIGDRAERAWVSAFDAPIVEITPADVSVGSAVVGERVRRLSRPLLRAALLAAVREAIEGGAPLAEIEPREHQGAPSFAGLRILVVEDDPINRLVTERLLTRLGVDVVTVSDGREAIERLSVSAVDLVLMDCEMPGMGGEEAAVALRAQDIRARSGRPLPLVALTGHTSRERHESCLRGGMSAVLTKPLAREALQEVIAGLVGLGGAGAPGPPAERPALRPGP